MNYKVLNIVLLTGFLLSCSEDFTDLAPVSQRNVANFYQTGSDLEVAVNAAYSALQQDGTYNEAYWIMQEMRSDNTDQGPGTTGLARERAVIEDFEEISTSEIITNAYVDSYLGIARCNTVLDRADPIDMDATLKERIKGEARFIRSLLYYHLAVSFGNIPLILTETQSVAEGSEHVQVSAETIYNQIVQDLIQAENALPISYDGSNLGRATKGAAATLLAKVYLTLGDNGSAETVLRRIISDYGYSLVPDYNDLWGVPNEHNVESIFEVEFQGGGFGEGNRFTNDFSPVPALQTSVGAYRNRPTRSMLAAYEPGDSRFFASMDTSYIDDQGMLLTNTADDVRFVVKYGIDNPFNEGDAPNNFIVFRFADVLLMLAEALGEVQEAYDLINQVRARAGLSAIDGSTPGTFQEKLLQERKVELAFENHRWADIIRFGVVDQIMTAEGKQAKLLFLIPQRELDLNSNFSQN
ncbi:MAG: RagB/SusD family nutrient uptake outer membrane protein [Cyclobacteriaceae bacterium]|nr:RagB/SusD family nutrient uptake outer membrane protein [Cyclobacteriaceae bacterium]